MSYFFHMPSRVIFHIDMDAFFASVEQRDNPSYKGKPVIVGAAPGMRGVVAAASYEARKFGIHSAMPINEAFRRCPKGVYVRPRGEVYGEESRKIMNILERFSPALEQVSVDEAFLDMSGTEKLFGEPVETARMIKERIFKETRLTASIGIAPNKFLAKIASDLNKPDGITVAPFDAGRIIEWMAPMKVGRIWGVGKKTQAVFESMGYMLVGDLQQLSLQFLLDKFGKYGADLHNLCRGIDDRPVGDGEMMKSLSREHTYNVDSRDVKEWKETLLILTEDVARRARRHGVKGGTVVLSYRRPDFSRHSRRKPLPYPTNVAKIIYENVLDLLAQIREPAIRLIGVGITGLDEEVQTDLFGEGESVKALEESEKAVDRVMERFGEVIGKGTEIGIRSDERKKRKAPGNSTGGDI